MMISSLLYIRKTEQHPGCSGKPPPMGRKGQRGTKSLYVLRGGKQYNDVLRGI